MKDPKFIKDLSNPVPFSHPNYRNYKAAKQFDANKARLDSAFYADLQRVCAAYSGAIKASCNGTAWTYYQAVKAFG